jgi:general stress protein 26
VGRSVVGNRTSMTDDQTRKVAELIKGERFAFLTTTAPDGTLTSRPMALQEVEFDGDLWFFAERNSRKMSHLLAHPQVNVATGSGGSWVSLTGQAAVVYDAAKKRELWNSAVEAWFPEGPDDGNVVLLKVEGTSAEYWDSPGGRLATLISFAKAKVTGQRIDAGENETVDL